MLKKLFLVTLVSLLGQASVSFAIVDITVNSSYLTPEPVQRTYPFARQVEVKVTMRHYLSTTEYTDVSVYRCTVPANEDFCHIMVPESEDNLLLDVSPISDVAPEFAQRNCNFSNANPSSSLGRDRDTGRAIGAIVYYIRHCDSPF